MFNPQRDNHLRCVTSEKPLYVNNLQQKSVHLISVHTDDCEGQRSGTLAHKMSAEFYPLLRQAAFHNCDEQEHNALHISPESRAAAQRNSILSFIERILR